MPSKLFNMQPTRGAGVDKDLTIYGPDGLRITIDYDDVNHRAVMAATKRMVKVLNEAWRNP